MRLALALCFLTTSALAQVCAATPEAAARATIGTPAAASTGPYRVADLQVDPVLKRAWLRIVRCDDATAPAVLVPIAALLHGNADAPASPAHIASSTPRIIHAGDAVHAVLVTASLNMTLDATADQPGAVGDVISLTLRRRAGQPADEPEHRIRGTVRADKTVEVQP